MIGFRFRQENLRLKAASRENDQTLEELGQQLSWNKLQLDTLKVRFTLQVLSRDNSLDSDTEG